MKKIKYSKHSLEKFSKELACKTPTPGGGSASAQAASMSAGLNSMVLQYSFGKNPSVKKKKLLKSLYKKTEKLRKTFLNLIELDSLAYERLRMAYKLKKTIKPAILYASNIPMKTAELAYENLQVSKTLVKIGNPRLVTDIGCAILLNYTAIHGAGLNVLVNIKELKGTDRVKKTKFIKRLINKSKTITIALLNIIERKLC